MGMGPSRALRRAAPDVQKQHAAHNVFDRAALALQFSVLQVDNIADGYRLAHIVLLRGSHAHQSVRGLGDAM